MDPANYAKMEQLLNETSANPEKELTIEEEYDLWKSNVPLMYDFVSETKLVWPSLMVEWLPGKSDSTRQEMLIGTHTSGSERNHLKLAVIDLPEEVVCSNHDDDDEDNSNEPVKSNIKIIKKFRLGKDEITRARYMPQESNIIATIDGKGVIRIFNSDNDSRDAEKTLKFHKDNGYGLSFNKHEKGRLLSASDDGTVALWDILGDSNSPVRTWESQTSDIINDCKWHYFEKDMFGTVSEDNILRLHDLRNNKDNEIVKISSGQPFNTLAFSKHSKNLFAAAGNDSNIYLYDMRNTSEPLHSMSGHEDSVTNLEFDDHEDGIVVSSGADRRVIVWDLAEIGAEQLPEDAEDGTPEVLMVHAGHRSPINDFSINPNIPWLMASSEEDNIIQVWKCSSKLPKVGGVPKVNMDLIR